MPLKKAIVGFPSGEIRKEDVFQHRKYVALARHPLEKGSQVLISSEFKPSGVAGTGAPFRTRVEGIVEKSVRKNLGQEDVLRLRKIHKPAGSRVVPHFNGKNLEGPFSGAFIVKPVTAAREKRILQALYEASQKR